MFCYNVVDDCIVLRKLRRKCVDDEAMISQLKKEVNNARVRSIGEIKINPCHDLFMVTKELTSDSEELSEYDWFVSTNNRHILALAVMCVIERKHLWRLLQDSTAFYEWIKSNVR